MAYGAERGVPWGVSESAYNLRDRHQTYQYRAFGVPDLALKRGLGRDLVVAPYASALAAMVTPQRALANLGALEKMGALGPYGFRDALDYTRPEPGARFARGEQLHGAPRGDEAGGADQRAADQTCWQRRFHADPLVRSAELLLHERIPRRLGAPGAAGAPRPTRRCPTRSWSGRPCARWTRCDTPQPHVALLGHLPYTLMVSHCGAGYSRYERAGGHPLAGRRHPRTTPASSATCKDVTGGARSGRPRTSRSARRPTRIRRCWPPTGSPSTRADGDIETRTEIAVVPSDSAEVRRVTLTNHGEQAREMELTSYGEIVLAPPDADRAHPAFAQSLRRDRVARLVYGDHRHPPPALGERAAAVVRPRGGRRPGPGGPGELRDRPRAVRGPRPHHPRSRGAGGRRAAVGHHRRRARPDVRAAHPGAARAGAVRVGGVHDAGGRHAASAPSSWPTATTTPTRRSARSTWPGPPPRWSCASSASRRSTPPCSRSWPATSSTPTPALRAPQAELRRNRGGQPLLWARGRVGRLAHPAGAPSTRRTGCPPCASSSPRTTTGAAAG